MSGLLLGPTRWRLVLISVILTRLKVAPPNVVTGRLVGLYLSVQRLVCI